MAKQKKEIKKPEFPIVFESFNKPSIWSLGGEPSEPSAFNGFVSVRKYRTTIELIEEPVEVIQGRLEKLWISCDNHYHYVPLVNEAKMYNYQFKGKFGEKKKSRN